MPLPEACEATTPEHLLKYGALEVVLPDVPFDPEGEWDLSWRIWLPRHGDFMINHRGFIRIRKTAVGKDTFNLNITRKILHKSQGCEHITEAEVLCRKDNTSSVLSFSLERNMYYLPEGDKLGHVKEKIAGEAAESGIVISREGNERTLPSDTPFTSEWSLFEAMMRAPENIPEGIIWILDELDKPKKGVFKKTGPCEVTMGKTVLAATRYERIGSGALPWAYYTDESGRLVLAYTGMRSFVLDAEAEERHERVKESFSSEFKSRRENAEISEREFSSVRLSDSRQMNFLFLTTDQQSYDTISALGNKYVSTPNLDRLVEKGVTFEQSFSTNPVCSPARSSWFTGRTTCETGVISNGLGIRPDIPNLGQWLKGAGYDTAYAGKWHVPGNFTYHIPGFEILPGGMTVQGTLGDQAASGLAAGWLMNRTEQDSPFFLTVNFLQPHDVCNWIKRYENAEDIEFDIPEEELPPLPDNFGYDPAEPEKVKIFHRQEGKWSEKMYRYYLWSYCRMVEEVDAEIGRVLDALEASSYADNTAVIFTSDHGEGCGKHQTVVKNFLYDDVVRIPLIISVPAGKREVNSETLTSGLDIVPTVCELACVSIPEGVKGISLVPRLRGEKCEERGFVVSEVFKDAGRMIRSMDWKLIIYRDDPCMQLFDLKNDPGETVNLAGRPEHLDVIEELKSELNRWEAELDRASGTELFQV